MSISIKRVYESYSPNDGKRVLVDRLWPRGIKKENAHIDVWLKEVAPSTELRKWFNLELEKWSEFQQRYQQELSDNEAFKTLQQWVQTEKVTLIYSSRDQVHNSAAVLQKLLS